MGELLEGAAPAKSAARAASSVESPAFGSTLLGLLGGEPVPAAADDEAVIAEPPLAADPLAEDADASLMTLLPGIDLIPRRIGIPEPVQAIEHPATEVARPGVAAPPAVPVDSLGRAAVPAPAIAPAPELAPAPLPVPASVVAIPATTMPVPALKPAMAAVEPQTIASAAVERPMPAGSRSTSMLAATQAAVVNPMPPTAAGAGNVPGAMRAPMAAPAPTAAPVPTQASASPAVVAVIADTTGPARESGRFRPVVADPLAVALRTAPTRAPVAEPPATAELQARRQFAAQAAAAATPRVVGDNAPEAPVQARAAPRPSPLPPPPVSIDGLTRVNGGKPDVLAPLQRSAAMPGVDTAPGVGGTWTSANPALGAPAIATTPVLAGADGRAAWQQALAQHVGSLVAGETAEARLQIESGKLGPIEVRVKIEGERVDVRFSIQHPITASLVQEAMPRLERMLEQHGFSLGHSSIDQGQSREQGSRDSSASSRSTPVRVAGDGEARGDERSRHHDGHGRAANALLDDFA